MQTLVGRLSSKEATQDFLDQLVFYANCGRPVRALTNRLNFVDKRGCVLNLGETTRALARIATRSLLLAKFAFG